MRPTLLSGLDLVAPHLPEGLVRWDQPAPLAPLPDYGAAVRAALAGPRGSAPLSARVGQHSRVVVVYDDPAQAAPPALYPVWPEALRAIVAALREQIADPRRIELLCASGLGRRPGPAELAAEVGPDLASAHPLRAHDAEAHRGFVSLAAHGDPVELARALAEADLVVYLSVRGLGPRAPLQGLLEGAATYRTLRALHTPAASASARHAWLAARGELLAQRLPLFSVSVVLNGTLFNPALEQVLRAEGPLARPARTWNRLPYAVRQRAALLWRGEAKPCAVFAGAPLQAEAEAEAVAERQRRAAAPRAHDVLVVQVPDLGPHGHARGGNPVLAAHLGLVTLLGPARGLLRPGGVAVLCNPLREDLDRTVHLPYVDFYERLLRHSPTGAELRERFELAASGRPEYVAAYQRRGAVHGAHPFFRWYELEQARAGLGQVIVAGAGAAASQRLGLEHADTVELALTQAGELLGQRAPSIGLLGLMPPWAN